jgi:hypothetical protein
MEAAVRLMKSGIPPSKINISVIISIIEIIMPAALSTGMYRMVSDCRGATKDIETDLLIGKTRRNHL